LELARLRDGMSVIDWGCAYGGFAALIAEQCPTAEVIACDIPYPHGAPNFADPRIRFVLLDEAAPRLPIADATIDRIFLLDVLEHMGPSTRPVALAEMRRVLKPDGLIVVTVPYRGLLHWTDVENVRMNFPRLHRAVFSLVRGRAFYDERYGDNRLVNFSSDAVEHHHYQEAELVDVLASAGFAAADRRFFGVLSVVPWALIMLVEAVRRKAVRRVPALERGIARVNLVSMDATPPRVLADSIGISGTVARP
jgi:SAM-dependent methyltransferase